MMDKKEDSVLIIEGTESKLEQPDKFKTSYFCNEYHQAFMIVERIINQTLDRKEKRGVLSPIHNIVPFIGKRGSGKTSAMMSFANALNNYFDDICKKQEVFSFYRKSNGKETEKLNVQFTCIDFIDGSLLEKGEDVFKIILAQMYGKFLEIDQYGRPKDKAYEFEKRELQQQFDKIYRSACKLEMESRTDSYYEESSITSLKNLSSSLTVKTEFEDMIQRYLKMFRVDRQQYGAWDERNRAEHFLVIMIDDLDLNVNNGYDMLEKIHRYMMVDNIIVLLSMDYDQVKLLCERKFYSMVPNYDAKLKEKSNDVERLAQDFLDKVLPANMRVYMPMLNKTPDIKVRTESEEERGLKEALFKKIYEKLGMRMDVGGTKRHFYEQNSLRTFVSFYLMLDDMKMLDGSSKEEEDFEQNYKILMFDTITRMVDERLNHECKAKFIKFTEPKLPLPTRNLYIEVLNSGKNMQEKDALENLRKNLEFYGYSYGEILRIIYCWGRVSSERKEFMRCLLAFYSLELMRTFYRSLSEDIEKREKAIERLINTVNGSVAGSWAERMFPSVITSKEFKKRLEIKMGIVKDVDMKKVFSIPVNDLLENKATICIDENFDFEKEIPEAIKIFRSVLTVGMFFEQQHYKVEKSFNWKLTKPIKEEVPGGVEENRKKLSDAGVTLVDPVEDRIFNTEGKGTFNIFNFVANAMDYEGNIKPLVESLYEVLFSGSKKEQYKERILNEIGIEEEFRKWKNYSGGFAIPLYDIDIIYNVMKRLRQREEFDNKIESGEALEFLKKTYSFVKMKLKENDDWYEKTGVELKPFSENGEAGKYHIRFAEAFDNCPYMRWLYGEDQLLDNFNEIFKHIVDNLPSPESALPQVRYDMVFYGYED